MQIFKQGQTSEIPASEYGGKAANLSELVNAGFNVPPGFVFAAGENTWQGGIVHPPGQANHYTLSVDKA